MSSAKVINELRRIAKESRECENEINEIWKDILPPVNTMHTIADMLEATALQIEQDPNLHKY